MSATDPNAKPTTQPPAQPTVPPANPQAEADSVGDRGRGAVERDAAPRRWCRGVDAWVPTVMSTAGGTGRVVTGLTSPR